MSSHVAFLQYSPDGATLAVALGDRTGESHSPSIVRLLDSRTGIPVGPEWAFETGVWCLAFSPDGASVAVGQSDGTTQIRALPQDNPLGKPLDILTTCICFDATADGRMAFGSGSGEVLVSDPATGQISVLTRANDRGIWGLVFATDGRTLAIGTGFSSSTDRGPPDAEVWIYDTDRRERACPPIRVGHSRALPYRFSKDGTILYTRGEDRKTLRLWDAKTGTNLGRDLTGGPDTTSMAVSIDDLVVFQGDRQGRVSRRELDGGKPIGEPWEIQSDRIDRILVNPDGRTFLTNSADGSVRLRDIESGRPLGPPIEHEAGCRLSAMSSDGRTLATASNDGVVRFWDAPTGLPLGPPRSQIVQDINRLAFLSKGDRLAVAIDSIVYLIPTPGEITGDTAQIRRWAEATAGWAIDEAGTVARLNATQWERRRQELSAGSEGFDHLGSRARRTATWRSPYPASTQMTTQRCGTWTA